MKKLALFSCFLLLVGCSAQQPSVRLTNPSNTPRPDELIVLTRAQIKEKTGAIPPGLAPVPYLQDSALPAQLDDLDNDGRWDELAFLVNFSETNELVVHLKLVEEQNYPEFEPRTNVRLGILGENGVQNVTHATFSANQLPVPLYSTFQMDGIAWENDKAGFRQYFDGRNARDIFGKTSPKMALDTVGIAQDGSLVDNYHVMLSWGRDILAVGNSLGLGGLALQSAGQVHRLGVRLDASKNNINETSYTLITEGPVRSIFKTTYKGWNINGQNYNVYNTITIQAGKYGYKNSVRLESPQPADTLLVGLVNINNDQEPSLFEVDNRQVFLTHDHQTYNDEWVLGMALVFPSELYQGYQTAPNQGAGVTNSYLNALLAANGQPVTYHVFFGWELSDPRFKDRSYFEDFITGEAQKISNPILIK